MAATNPLAQLLTDLNYTHRELEVERLREREGLTWVEIGKHFHRAPSTVAGYYHSCQRCHDCRMATQAGFGPYLVREVYMVADWVWRAAHAEPCKFLCIGCLEQRLGRLLTPTDFKVVPLNLPDDADSERLTARRGDMRDRITARFGKQATVYS